jgi:pimeloyl-ACP methyl ester carboxylesterase/DNA-binding CsgD family transcriptional regulator
MDPRGCGLSDWDVTDISFDAWVGDLEAVVDAAGLERFALLGHSQGGAIAVEYAVRHPERVTQLVLLGSYARGAMKRELPSERVEELQAQLKLIEVGWGRDDPSYRQMFSTQFMPGGTLEQINSMSELQRRSATPENAVRAIRNLFSIDVCEAASRIKCPTLILHARGDRRAPFEEGLRLAGLIPDARLVPLETNNHILLSHEPAFRQFFEELEAFIPQPAGTRRRGTFPQLTRREAEVLERIAQGLDNAQIAAHLGLSEKTVRNNITHIFAKLGVENRPQAIVLARDNGLGKTETP